MATYAAALPDPDAPPPTEFIAIAVRAAAEGVPVAAIARTLRLPYDRVLHYLTRAKRLGAITEVPRPDWPPAQSPADRSPAPALPLPRPRNTATVTVASTLPSQDVEFLCRHTFRLTNLEAGFLAVLLKCLFADKEKLHAVIESQRATRAIRPAQEEVTDVKMVDVMICKLRKKMTLHAHSNELAVPVQIRTSWGKGYFLDPGVKDMVYQMLDAGMGSSAHGARPARPALPVVPSGGRAAAARAPA